MLVSNFRIIYFYLSFLLVLICIACNKKESENKKFKIGFSQAQSADNWRETMLREMKREVSFHNNIEFYIKDAEANSKKQKEQIDELLQMKIDLLIVSPHEITPLNQVLEKVYNSNIPIVLIDRRINSERYTAYIGASNYDVGQNAGKYAISLIKGKGKVLEVTGLFTASPFIDRDKGFTDIISKKKGIDFIAKINDHEINFEKKLDSVIKNNRDLNVIFAHSDYIAKIVYQICKKNGVEKSIKIIGVDGLSVKDMGMDMVANKQLKATVLYPTGGQESIQTAINILENKPFRKENALESTIIDSTNVKILQQQSNKVIEQQKLLQKEKDKSERLILKIMPKNTIEDLKNHGTTSARAYKTVSVLFTDFVGFTKKAEGMKPTELVSKLDVYFTKFDEIIVKNNLEKIKTIGDAYMCAGGVPVRNNTNPIDTCLAALQIQDYITTLNDECAKNGTPEDAWELRLGINTGEVTAGVIGNQRLAYDIWGSTVNRAQRMEMLGQPGKVTITGETFKLIEPYFECTFRGKAQSKSKREILMYTVERIKPQLSADEKGIVPNERFHQIVNLYLYSSINYNKAERYITKILKEGLSDKLHYHSLDHMQDVVQAVERIALTENITDEGLFLLKSAASYHDAGFIEQYDKNEPIGARMAEEILPKFGYNEQHIEQIKQLIYVTQIPHKPQNKLEEIICDADLDYLGRDDFHQIADKLRLELREHGKIDSDRKWDEIQVQFLTNHKYFTQSAIDTRRNKKLKHLEEIKKRLEENNYID